MVVVEVEDVADAVEVDAVAVDAVAVVATAATVVVATAVVDPMVRFTPPAVTVIGPFKHVTTLSQSCRQAYIHTHTNPQHLYLHIHTSKYYNTYTIYRKLQNVQKRIHPRSNHYYVRTFFFLTL